MKERVKILCLFSLLLAAGSLAGARVDASENEEEIATSSQRVDEEEIKDSEGASREDVKELVAALSNLNQVDRFQTTTYFINQRNQQKMMTMYVVGDNETNDLAMDITFNVRGAFPANHHLRLLAYHNFDLVYINALDYLNSMAFFDQAHFPPNFQAVLAEAYSDYYVLLDSSQVETNLAMNELTTYSLLLPNLTRLSAIAPEHLTNEGDYYHLKAERLEIPENTFAMMQHLSLVGQINGEMKANSGSQRPQLDLKPHFQFLRNNRGAEVILKNQIKMDSALIPYDWEAEGLEEPPNFQTERSYQSHSLSRRTTACDLNLNPLTQTYHLILDGIAETVNLNLFEKEPSNIRTFDFQIDYLFHPTEERVPALSELKRLSMEELDFIIEDTYERLAQEALEEAAPIEPIINQIGSDAHD